MAEKEYIEREAAIEYLTLNMGWNDENGYPVDDLDERKANIADPINGIPAADVRPVVRCRDCKYGQGAKMDFWNEYEGIECIGGVVHRKDWFCADGEKMEES